ncbi:MAG: flavodoxin family protein [Candidatus Omnitrophota bacterium]
MRVLGIGGSPRAGGNTDILLDEALRGARSKSAVTEKVILNDLKMVPCQECIEMPNDGKCIIKDDFESLYKKISAADAIIIASPIFFGSVSAQTKIMIDRFQCAWRYKYILKKPPVWARKQGAFISAEGSSRKDFFDNAKAIIKNLFATINVDYKGELLCCNMDEKGAIQKNPDFLKKAFKLGCEMV